MTQITKERMVSVSTDKLIIPRNFEFVSSFFENFLIIFLLSNFCRFHL